MHASPHSVALATQSSMFATKAANDGVVEMSWVQQRTGDSDCGDSPAIARSCSPTAGGGAPATAALRLRTVLSWCVAVVRRC